MQKLIVFSDIHKKLEILDYLQNKYPDLVKICLGDCEMEQSVYEKYINSFIFVRGNSDLHFDAYLEEPMKYEGIKILSRSTSNLVPKEMLIRCEKINILLCHGHLIVKGYKDYRQHKDADLLLVGHSHHFELEVDENDVVRTLNPGCSNSKKVRDLYSNWEKKPPSYVELTLDKGKVVDVEQIYYPEELY